MRNSMKKLMILCLSLCLLAGCGGGAKKTVKLYFADRAGQEILEEERSVQAKDSVLETAIRSLLSGPKTPDPDNKYSCLYFTLSKTHVQKHI